MPSREPTDESDIVVTATASTATKTDTPILRIPQAIEVVTVEEMQDRGAQNIREALKYTAGVYNGGDDSRGDFNIVRGFESVLCVDGLKRNYGFVYAAPRNRDARTRRGPSARPSKPPDRQGFLFKAQSSEFGPTGFDPRASLPLASQSNAIPMWRATTLLSNNSFSIKFDY
ncbi:hypothetical protein OUZ56_027543 [Daphnia magna]|uniref:TonB-dependent receptor plug domain-containing protein n=1 Tax=Daphnia magna TaxID=35525 RepID=A0ABQ9ZQ31_9CRUS|nr:hypothetical protein OUZ56_027543 [Daphnia magna]